MIEIENKIVSLELFTSKFCCDLPVCGGECCVEGNSGAPLDEDECEILKDEWGNYHAYMKPEGVKAIEQQGFSVLDEDMDHTTPLISGAECAYSIETPSGTWCAIEKAWSDGKTSFRKPVSCHLYPIREVKFASGMVGLQYHRWSICRSAEILGDREGTPVFRSLKDSIERRYGVSFYNQMEIAYDLILEEMGK